ncbi:MAG: hypothetical protein A2W91_11475 [Bacteroidetes bacterium GWF2_38_335]|nr:MAG: hypothetical protein A2W91_11475 [Bacteroidetes bacterium GWF2_38_335]HBS87748.1 hypothetical protein [Bacteroidales bacterium]
MENEKQIKSIYMIGAISTIIVLIGIIIDIVIGNITGGNLADLPQTAIGRFEQFNENKFLGLYNLDLLNVITQMILIPAYIALFIAHRNVNFIFSLMALIVFLFGSVIMVSNNVALPMYELSNKYFATSIESQKAFYAAAGESMLAKGAHGSSGIFIGFFIPNIAGLLMSIVMLQGRVFSRINAWIGIIGSVLIMVYVILVNFVPGVETMATAFAMPGGLLLMTWMILFTIKLLKLRKEKFNL